MIHKRFELYSREGEKLRSDLRYVPDGKRKPVILFLHGFKGFKDWGPFPAMLEEFAKSGFVTIAFNSSHNGIGDDLPNFTELDRFEHNTFTRELEEVEDVLTAIDSLKDIPIDEREINGNNNGLLGHSRGAAMAILAGARATQVRAVVALSSVSTFERYSERQKEKWRAERVFTVRNQRTKQIMRLDVGLLDDLEMNHDRLDILKAAHSLSSLHKPLLLVTGSEDLTTPLKETEAIAEAAKGDLTELHVIPNTGHTFGAEHPFKGMNGPLRKVIELSKSFFGKYLSESV